MKLAQTALLAWLSTLPLACRESSPCDADAGEACSADAASAVNASDASPAQDAAAPFVRRRPRPETFADCAAFTAAVREQALRDMHHYVDEHEAREVSCDRNPGSSIDGIFGSGGIDYVGAYPDSTSRAFTDTNTQTRGVDEGDIVETDGRYLYIASQGLLRILEAWPPERARELTKVRFDGAVKQLMLHGTRLVVVSTQGLAPRPRWRPPRPVGAPACDGSACGSASDLLPSRLTILDVSGPAEPKTLRELTFSGSVAALRRIGATLHAVVVDAPVATHSNTVSIPSCVSTEFERASRLGGLKRYRAESEAAIRSADVLALIPRIHDSAFPPAPETCQNIGLAASGRELTFTSLVSIDLEGQKPTTNVKLVDDPGIVYVSGESAYLAVPPPRSFAPSPPVKETFVHRFGVGADPAESRYRASGRVPGSAIDQFALDEWQGHLRIATAVGDSAASRYNVVSVLAEEAGELRTVGLIDHIAPREDIRSARFMGPRAYVVTFETTDPLFILALEDPRAPRILSELKVEGFSTYIHPLDETHLLTIGYGTQTGQRWDSLDAVRLQLFDVGDPLAPVRTHELTLGTRGASDALHDHLAFTYYPEKKVLALPMAICEGGDGSGVGSETTFAGLMIYDVDVQAGIRERGRIPFPVRPYRSVLQFPERPRSLDAAVPPPPPPPPPSSCLSSWFFQAHEVQRGVMIDDYVYAIARDLVKVRSLSALGQDLVDVPLPVASCSIANTTTLHGEYLPANPFQTLDPRQGACACACFDGAYECIHSRTRERCMPE